MNKHILMALLICFGLSLSACSDQDEQADTKASIRKTLVTVTQVKKQAIAVKQTSVGFLEGLVNPTLAAEMAARVIQIHVDTGQAVKKGQLIATLDATDYIMQRNEARAEVARLNALLANQSKTVERNQTLVDKKFISQNAVDDVRAQENVYKQQLKAARARVASINHNSSKSKVSAPVDGIIESKPVNAGDYLRAGDPIVQIVSKQSLRAHLPFPERIGASLKPGLKVLLNTPTSDETIETVIQEIKPQISASSRSIDVIADVNNAEGWQPGATVTGTVTVDELPAAIMVPEQSLVLRPAGEVVYVVRDNQAYQAIVSTGLRQNGMIEILSGLQADETVVVDGAGFLTDKAPVEIKTHDPA